MPVTHDVINLKQHDAKIIEELFIEGVESGSYTKDILENKQNFHRMIAGMVNNEQGHDKYGRMILSLGCQYRNITIGFLTIAVDDSNNEVEIWHFSLLKQYRNKGLGNSYLNILFQIIEREFGAKRLMARCHKTNSLIMQNILTKNRFVQKETNAQGFIIFRK